jgi:hypothetical protein
VNGGGTQWRTIVSGTLLTGNGAGALSTTTPVYPLSISSNLLSLAFGTTTQNFWNNYNNFSSLYATNASSTHATTTDLTITGITSKILKTDTNGLVGGATAGTDYQAPITATWPITLTGAAVGFNGLSTSTAAVIGNLTYFTGVNTVGNVATTAATCTTGASCTGFTVIGPSPISITTTLGTSVDLVSEIIGTLGITNGGTGTTTNRYGGLFFGDGSIFRQASTTGLLDYDPTAQRFTTKYASSTAASVTNIDVSGIANAATGIFTSVLRTVYSAALSLATNGDFGVDSTSNQFRYRSNGADFVLGNGNIYPAFSYSTTTWTGTTTIPLGTAYIGETWNGVQCFTDTGTLNVSFYDGTNRMNMLNASTTVGTVTLSSNNTFVAAEKRYVDIGTPATSPTKVACTVSKSFTSD